MKDSGVFVFTGHLKGKAGSDCVKGVSEENCSKTSSSASEEFVGVLDVRRRAELFREELKLKS